MLYIYICKEQSFKRGTFINLYKYFKQTIHSHKLLYLKELRELQDGTGALFTERIDFLACEADEQAIFLLVVGDELDNVSHRLGHRNTLYCSLSS